MFFNKRYIKQVQWVLDLKKFVSSLTLREYTVLLKKVSYIRFKRKRLNRERRVFTSNREMTKDKCAFLLHLKNVK